MLQACGAISSAVVSNRSLINIETCANMSSLQRVSLHHSNHREGAHLDRIPKHARRTLMLEVHTQHAYTTDFDLDVAPVYSVSV